MNNHDNIFYLYYDDDSLNVVVLEDYVSLNSRYDGYVVVNRGTLIAESEAVEMYDLAIGHSPILLNFPGYYCIQVISTPSLEELRKTSKLAEEAYQQTGMRKFFTKVGKDLVCLSHRISPEPLYTMGHYTITTSDILLGAFENNLRAPIKQKIECIIEDIQLQSKFEETQMDCAKFSKYHLPKGLRLSRDPRELAV